MPEGPWKVTAKLDHTAIAANGQAPGLVLFGQQNPNYFAKTAIQYKTNDLSGQPLNGIWAERVLTTNGTINAQLRRPVPEHRQAHAADQRPLAACQLSTART